MHLDLSVELVELLEHALGLQCHVVRLQRGKRAHLPAIPRHLPLLSQLPYLLQVVQILRHEEGGRREEGGGRREEGGERREDGGKEGGWEVGESADVRGKTHKHTMQDSFLI